VSGWSFRVDLHMQCRGKSPQWQRFGTFQMRGCRVLLEVSTCRTTEAQRGSVTIETRNSTLSWTSTVLCAWCSTLSWTSTVLCAWCSTLCNNKTAVAIGASSGRHQCHGDHHWLRSRVSDPSLLLVRSSCRGEPSPTRHCELLPHLLSGRDGSLLHVLDVVHRQLCPCLRHLRAAVRR